MVTLSQLHEIYRTSLLYVDLVEKRRWMEGRTDVSPFWADLLSDRRRRNYPPFHEMLMMRRGATYPLADRGIEAHAQDELRQAEAAYYVVSRSCPPGYLKGLRESWVGAPFCFEFDGNVISAGGMVNALTTQRVLHWCRTLGLGEAPLRVLEIGAGYGHVAYQLFCHLPIRSYAICDLPQNLFLSSFFMQGNFPQKTAVFVDDRPVDQAADLLFLVPPLLHRLEGPFDLVVNSYSFQEMNLESVQEYFEFVAGSLGEPGFFYSLNAHGKAGVRRPSDYPVEQFDLVGFRSVRRFPFQLFATSPYELVMTRRTRMVTKAGLDGLRTGLDALGEAIQLGLHDEFFEICHHFAGGQLTETEQQWLDALSQFFRVEDHVAKLSQADLMRKTGYLRAVTSYLAGNVLFARGEMDMAARRLEESLSGLSESAAAVRALVMLAALGHGAGRGAEFRGRAETLAPHLQNEIVRYSADRAALIHAVGSQLRVEVPLWARGKTIPGRVLSRFVRKSG